MSIPSSDLIRKMMKESEAFGAKVSFDESSIVLIPVPWEMSVSYGKGTSLCHEAIREASSQLDFYSYSTKTCINSMIYMENPSSEILELSTQAQNVFFKDKDFCTDAQARMLDFVYNRVKQLDEAGKKLAVIGGDHSVSEGIVKYWGEKLKGDYGLLHLDAHADLRESYQGFRQSHACVMNNILNLKHSPKKLVQVGLRDFCEQEYLKITEDARVQAYFDQDIKKRSFQGENWADISAEIISQLPDKIYISFDIDALNWSYAPGTGTPVPGGLSFSEACFLLEEIKRQKKEVISFDLVETSCQVLGEWNANVAARLIYRLCNLF